jgi:hypothetical protein
MTLHMFMIFMTKLKTLTSTVLLFEGYCKFMKTIAT